MFTKMRNTLIDLEIMAEIHVQRLPETYTKYKQFCGQLFHETYDYIINRGIDSPINGLK